MAQDHLQPSSINKRLLPRHHPATNPDASSADSTSSLRKNNNINNIRANMPTSDQIMRRAASVDDGSFHAGREKYQRHQLLPNRLLFGPRSPDGLCSSNGGHGRVRATNDGVTAFEVDEMRTESSTHVQRQAIPQDRSFLHDREEATTANNNITGTRSLIFRQSPATKSSEQLLSVDFQLQLRQQEQFSETTPGNNLLAYSSPLGTFSIPGIRPSLSCPTSVFDSPLLPRSTSANQQHIMTCPSNDTTATAASTNRFDAVDVSAIEYCSEEDVTPSDDDAGDEIQCSDVTIPMRNLSDAFELLVAGGEEVMSKKQLQCPKQAVRGALSSTCDVTFEDKSTTTASTCSTSTKPSPTSVLGFETNDSLPLQSEKKGEAFQLENGITVLRMSLPHFQLHEDLRGEMSQGLIDRVSFYSIVRDVNKEAADAAMTDPKGLLYNYEAIHLGRRVMSNNDKSSGKDVVRAKDGKVHAHPILSKENNNILVLASIDEGVESMTPAMGPALLDEEWWLLSAMASRSPEEVALNHASALPSTFSEALGEKDGSAADSMSSSSKTQLWKPGRSWWEAKSGKNPWVEPDVHNNRWRYLWPLIHYHKFLAKSIRKLRRNGIDVRTSTSSLSLFLRQEVCNVSDHLAHVSKYDSEEWTNALSCFDGWSDQSCDVEESVQNLVLQQKLQGINEMSDMESSLIRSQIDDAIFRAMRSEKEKETQDSHPNGDASDATKRLPTNDSKNSNWKRPPVHNRTPNKSMAALRGARWNSAGYNAPYAYQGMHGQRVQPYNHYMPSSYGHHHYHHHQYNGYDHYPTHHHLGYAGVHYPMDQYGHQHYYQNFALMEGGFSEVSSFDDSAHVSEMSVPFSHSDQTPVRYENNAHGYPPASPFWNHLNLSQLPGLSSPGCHLSPAPSFNTHHSQTENSTIDVKAKSLIMFPKQTNSPASRFTMSPQDESHPYYSAKNTAAPVRVFSVNDSVIQDESFVIPTIEAYSAETPQKQRET